MIEKYSLSIQNVSKKYKNGFEVKPITLNIEKGLIVGIIGLNGSGKTTFLSSIYDSEKRDSGEVFLFGQHVTRNNIKILEEIGVVKSGQDFPYDFNPIMIGKIMRNIYSKWDMEKFLSLLEKLDIDKTTFIKNFSSGMKSKLSIAMALSQQSKLLILDEPTNGLDIPAREKIRECLYDFVADGENIIIITSHILSDIEKISDRIIIMKQGEILFDKNKDDLMQNYAIYKICSEQMKRIDKKDFLTFQKRELYTTILVENKYKFENKYKIEAAVCGIEDIIELFLRENK